MSRITFVVAMAAIGSAGPAAAQSCGPATGMPLTAQEISQLLGGRWACASLSESQHWNELHSFPFVLDYKQGPAEPGNVDPSDTPSHPTGRYVVTGLSASAGMVTYLMGSASYAYTIVNNLGGSIPWTSPAAYSFCSAAGGMNLAVTISATHC